MSAVVKYDVRPATEEDVVYLSPRLRDVDRLEIKFISGNSAEKSILFGFQYSDKCLVGTANDEPICIFGVKNYSSLSDRGIIWMLGTAEVSNHSIRFLRECKSQLNFMISDMRYLENWVYCENKVTIRWLKWLGFKVESPKPVGLNGELFCHFYMENI